jgi:DNA-binding IclR family transcriptional regulator
MGKKIRQCGYALDHAEECEDVHCVGALVFNATDAMVATIWISGQEVVLPKEKCDEYGDIVKEHAMRVSERLGYNA